MDCAPPDEEHEDGALELPAGGGGGAEPSDLGGGEAVEPSTESTRVRDRRLAAPKAAENARAAEEVDEQARLLHEEGGLVRARLVHVLRDVRPAGGGRVSGRRVVERAKDAGVRERALEVGREERPEEVDRALLIGDVGVLALEALPRFAVVGGSGAVGVRGRARRKMAPDVDDERLDGEGVLVGSRQLGDVVDLPLPLHDALLMKDQHVGLCHRCNLRIGVCHGGTAPRDERESAAYE